MTSGWEEMHPLRTPHKSTLQSSRAKGAKTIGSGALFLVLVLTGCAGSGSPDISAPTTIDPKIEELQQKVESLEEKLNTTSTSPPPASTQKPARYKILIESFIDAEDTIANPTSGGFLLNCAEYSYYKWSDTGKEFSETRRFRVRVEDAMPSNPGGSCRGS